MYSYDELVSRVTNGRGYRLDGAGGLPTALLAKLYRVAVYQHGRDVAATLWAALFR